MYMYVAIEQCISLKANRHKSQNIFSTNNEVMRISCVMRVCCECICVVAAFESEYRNECK